jgi:hypothetical protein
LKVASVLNENIIDRSPFFDLNIGFNRMANKRFSFARTLLLQKNGRGEVFSVKLVISPTNSLFCKHE